MNSKPKNEQNRNFLGRKIFFKGFVLCIFGLDFISYHFYCKVLCQFAQSVLSSGVARGGIPPPPELFVFSAAPSIFLFFDDSIFLSLMIRGYVLWWYGKWTRNQKMIKLETFLEWKRLRFVHFYFSISFHTILDFHTIFIANVCFNFRQ